MLIYDNVYVPNTLTPVILQTYEKRIYSVCITYG